MKKLLLTLILAVVSSGAMAEWVEITSVDEIATIYVDSPTIQ